MASMSMPTAPVQPQATATRSPAYEMLTAGASPDCTNASGRPCVELPHRWQSRVTAVAPVSAHSTWCAS